MNPYTTRAWLEKVGLGCPAFSSDHHAPEAAAAWNALHDEAQVLRRLIVSKNCSDCPILSEAVYLLQFGAFMGQSPEWWEDNVEGSADFVAALRMAVDRG